MDNLTKANPHLWKEIMDEDAGDIRHCFNCGTCISACPAAEAESPLLIRRLVRMVLLGLEDKLLEDGTPWMCVTCTNCEEMCPMGVKPFEVGLAIRRWQARKDDTYLPLATAEIFETGHTQPVEKVGELRKSLGLIEIPPTIARFPELLKQFRSMLRETEIVKNNDFMFKE